MTPDAPPAAPPAAGRPTIAGLFRSASRERVRDAARRLADEAKTVRIVPETLSGEVYASVFTAVMDRLDEILPVDLPRDVLAGAWSRYRGLQEYRDPERYPPGERYTMALMLSQTITSEHAPSVTPVVEFAGQRVELQTITLPVALELTVEGGELGIEDARIVSLSTGTCTYKVTMHVRYGEGAETLVAEKEGTLDVMPRYEFAEGVPIRALGDLRRPAPPADDAPASSAAPPEAPPTDAPPTDAPPTA